MSSIAGHGECSECSECICTVEPITGLKYGGEFCECDPSICYSEDHKNVGNIIVQMCIQSNLRTKDTLGMGLLSSLWRLSLSRRFAIF